MSSEQPTLEEEQRPIPEPTVQDLFQALTPGQLTVVWERLCQYEKILHDEFELNGLDYQIYEERLEKTKVMRSSAKTILEDKTKRRFPTS